MRLPGPSGSEGAGRCPPPGGRLTLALVAVGLVAATLVTLTAAPAAAEGATSARIIVGDLDGVLGPGSRSAPDNDVMADLSRPMDLDLRVLVENDGDEPLSDLTLVVEVHRPVTSRAALYDALDGELPGAASSVHTIDVLDGGSLSTRELVGVSQTISREELEWAARGAVRPVRIAVTRGLQVLDEVVVPIVWLSQVPGEPLPTTLVWPFDSPPLRTVAGAYHGGADREMRDGGRLDVLLRSLEHAVAPRVTFAPAPHLLEDLADRADGFTSFERQEDGALDSRSITAAGAEARLADQVLQRVREVAAELELSPLAATYASADLIALHSAGGASAELAADAALDGRRRLQRRLGRDVQAASHLLYGPVDEAVLDLVPGENVLVSYEATTGDPPGEEPDTASSVRSLRTPSGRLVTVIVADPYLEESLRELDHPAGPVVATQRVIAETAQAYLEARGDRVPLLLLPPADWDPAPRAATLLLRGLGRATWLELASPDTLVRRVDPEGPEFADHTLGRFSPEFASALEQASVSLAAAVGALPEGETRLGGRTAAELHDTLLRASSRWFRGANEAEAEALVRDVQRAADETFGDVEVATAAITLTSSQGQIPVTLQRSRGEAIVVAVEVQSTGQLRWDEQRSEPLLLEPGTSQTVSFGTEARSTGTFPVTVRVTDPSGMHELGRSRMTVRSTAISGTALSLIGLLILFLLLLGALRRPDRGPRFEVVP